MKMAFVIVSQSGWGIGRGGTGTTVTEFCDKHLLFKSMHKTKPICKEPHAHKRSQDTLSPTPPPQETPSSPAHLPLPLEFPQLGQTFTIDDFLRSLQLEHPPYYLSHLADPYFDPYFDHDADPDPPTAPLRTRPCFHHINQQYMERIGPLSTDAVESRVRVGKEVRVKYFKGEDEANKIEDYQEYVEDGEQAEGMEEETVQ